MNSHEHAPRSPAGEDHRHLGQALDLFHLQEEAPGAVFWHPRGLVLVRQLEEHVRRAAERDGYREVRTPLALRRPIWEASGHWEAFPEGMLHVSGDGDLALKPVSCPAHIQIVERMRPSWRDMPIRIAEHGIVHRNEPRGVLCGLFRLRQFVQDDGHVFCRHDQIDAEIERFLRRVRSLYESLGMGDVRAALSLRPKVRFGDDALWDRAEAALARGADAAGLAYAVQEGQGAFYGPKIELVLRDALGRDWQCGTLQLDFVLPERFALRYHDKDGSDAPMVMLHRALLGSFERFVAILLEHHQGRLPPWLAPVSARVVAVTDAQVGFAHEVHDALVRAGVRAEIERDASGPLPGRVAVARASKVPFLVIVGAREAAARNVVLRDLHRFAEPHGDRGELLPLDEAVAALVRRASPPDP